MAISYRNGTWAATSVSSFTCALSTPPGMFTGDRMIAIIASVAGSPTITPPTEAAWTQIGTSVISGTTLTTAVYYRDPVVSEPGTHTWTMSTQGRTMGLILAYGGMALGATPIVASAVGTADTAGPHATPSLAVGAGDWLLTSAVSRESPGTAAAITWTSSAGTERAEITASNTGTGAQAGMAAYDSNTGLTAGSYVRQHTANKAMSQTITWSIRLQAEPDAPSSVTGWAMGLPLR